jgi:hypothetical protein
LEVLNVAPLNDAFHSVDDQQQARPSAGLAVDPSVPPGSPAPATTQPATPAPADAWHSVPDPAAAQPAPEWQPPKSRLFVEDDDYHQGRERFVDQMMAEKYGRAALQQPDQGGLQAFANQQYPHTYGLGEALAHPVNALAGNTPLTPEIAYAYVKSQTDPAVIEQSRREFYGHYDDYRYLDLRDQMANRIADAYVESEMGKKAAQAAAGDANPNRITDDVNGYVNKALAEHGWVVGQGLPPVNLAKFPYANGADPVTNARGRTNALARGLSAVTWEPVYNLISLGMHGVGAADRNGPGGRLANDYADRMNAGQREIHAALPASDEATRKPYGVEGLVEKGVEFVPQLTGMGAVGKLGKAGHLLNTAVIFGQAGNATYDEIYGAAKGRGEADEVARQKATGGAVAVGAVNAWMMRFGAVPKWAEADPGFKARMTHILMSGVQQGGVGAGSDLTQQLANYALTGKDVEAQRTLDAAATMALAGAATGALSPTRKPAAPQGPLGPVTVTDPNADFEAFRRSQPPTPPAQQPPTTPPTPAEPLPPAAPPAAPPKNLKEAQQRRPKRPAPTATPPEKIAPGQPSPDLQVGPADLAPPAPAPAETPVAPAEAPAKPVEQPAAPAPTPTPAAPAKPAFDPERPLANLEDADGKMIVRGPEQVAWIQDAYKRVPDPTKWEQSVRDGKLPPPPAYVEAPKPAAPAPTPAPEPVEPPKPPAVPEAPARAAGPLDAAKAAIADFNHLGPKTPEQREAVEAGQKLGLTVHFFGSSTHTGTAFVDPAHPNDIFIHTSFRGQRAIRYVVGHEAGHSLFRRDPALLDKLLRSIDPADLGEKSRAYLERYVASGEAPGVKSADEYALKTSRAISKADREAMEKEYSRQAVYKEWPDGHVGMGGVLRRADGTRRRRLPERAYPDRRLGGLPEERRHAAGEGQARPLRRPREAP